MMKVKVVSYFKVCICLIFEGKGYCGEVIFVMIDE